MITCNIGFPSLLLVGSSDMYVSFGGLLMMLKGDPSIAARFELDQKLFILLRKVWSTKCSLNKEVNSWALEIEPMVSVVSWVESSRMHHCSNLSESLSNFLNWRVRMGFNWAMHKLSLSQSLCFIEHKFVSKLGC